MSAPHLSSICAMHAHMQCMRLTCEETTSECASPVVSDSKSCFVNGSMPSP